VLSSSKGVVRLEIEGGNGPQLLTDSKERGTYVLGAVQKLLNPDGRGHRPGNERGL